MYVCSCNALTDRQILSVAHEAQGSPERAYGLLGCEPQCAKCLPVVQAILDRAAELGAKLDADPSGSAPPRGGGR
jgi:bacterioferritin-associated ferredoxin